MFDIYWIFTNNINDQNLFFIFSIISLYLRDSFTYLGSSVSSTEKDIDTRRAKAWTANDSLSVIWKSDLTYKIKRSFFQATVVSILLYGCTTRFWLNGWRKKLNGNYTRILRLISNKSWRQHPTKQQLYGHLPPITKTIKLRRTRHVGHCWRSRDEFVRDVLLWTPSHERGKAGRPVRYLSQWYLSEMECDSLTWPIKWNKVSPKQRSYWCCYMGVLYGRRLNGWRKSLTVTTQECCEQFWTSPGGNTPQSTSCTATYLSSRKLSKLDEPDMQDNPGEAGTS